MTLANFCVECLKSMNITLLLCVAIANAKPQYSTSSSQLNSNRNERWVKPTLPAIRIVAQDTHTHKIIGNYVLAAHIIYILVIWLKQEKETMEELVGANKKRIEKETQIEVRWIHHFDVYLTLNQWKDAWKIFMRRR